MLFVGKKSKSWCLQKDVGGQTQRKLVGSYPLISAQAARPTALGLGVEMGRGAARQPEAESAVVNFVQSGHEQLWEKGDATLLETAEAHGITPPFSCRSGSCGSCLTKKLAGNVAYRTPVTAEHAEDEVLICCAVPAKDTETLILDL